MKVSAIIPAFNEESTIGNVLGVLKQSPDIDEIIVVSDGSTDRTVEICHKHNINVIELPKNVGKGFAIQVGEQNCSGDILLLLDADLIGLNCNHINKLVKPVLEKNIDMAVGVFISGRFTTDFAHKAAPFLSGQRAIKKQIFDNLANCNVKGYGIEIALTMCGKKENIKTEIVELEGLTHVMKEEKMGLIKGFGARMKMYHDIYSELKIARKKQM